MLQTRCAGCHPVHAPGSMTLAMWQMKIEAMRPRFAERGLPWLTADEERALLEYLRDHAGSG